MIWWLSSKVGFCSLVPRLSAQLFFARSKNKRCVKKKLGREPGNEARFL